MISAVASRAVSLRQRAHEHQKLDYNELSGGVDLSCLPYEMKTLNLAFNRFTGPLNLQKTPPLLEFIYCQSNCFSDLIMFASIPKELKALTIYDNKNLKGEINFSILPKNLFAEITTSGTDVKVL